LTSRYPGLRQESTNFNENSDSYLQVARLLVENARLDDWNDRRFAYVLLLATYQAAPDSPLALTLNYLSNKETLGFSIDSIIREEQEEMLIMTVRSCIAPFLWTMLNCGLSLTSLNSYDESLLFNRILAYMNMQFSDSKSQTDAFNGAVLEFGIILRNGISPNAPLHDSMPGFEASDLVAMDPDFMAVAWKLALIFSGWEEKGDDWALETERTSSR